jgi:hypothetical protein
MRKFVAILFLLLCSTFVRAAQKPDPADYTVKVHISASHLKTECANGICGNILSFHSVLNGKRIELSGIAVIVQKTLMPIVPGDYPAKLLRDIHNSDSTLFNQQYDLLLPDNIVWHCYTTGVTE